MTRDAYADEVTRIRPPEDGIVSSGRGLGFVGELWMGAVTGGKQVQADRLNRGRTYARAGRVRNLRVTPGFVTAEVAASDWFPVSIRLRTFDDAEWGVVRELLGARLATIAALLEHHVPRDFLEALGARGVRLVPTPGELEGDCSCADFAHPCAHTAAVHAVLAEALDGDPFLLLTLRGRTPEHLLAELRRSWGDDAPIRVAEARGDEEIGATELEHQPIGVPLAFVLKAAEQVSMGLRALGPPPGQVDLLRPLSPLYEAGAAIALEVALRESAPKAPKRRPPPSDAVSLRPQAEPRETGPRSFPPRPVPEDTMSQVPAVPADLTERVVNALAELGSAKSKDLADKIGVDMLLVREELISLEALGIVYRTGQTRGTRWWLG